MEEKRWQGKTMAQWLMEKPILGEIAALQETVWCNPALHLGKTSQCAVSMEDVLDASCRLARFADYFRCVFPETQETEGLLESPLRAIPAMQACLDEEKGIMLCESLLSYKSYQKKASLTSTAIMQANYQQRPIDIQGGLYSRFSTYDDLPRSANGQVVYDAIKIYVDTADTGKDYLCGIVYLVYQEEVYILDIIYTQESMEITEPAVAAMIYFNKVTIADIESNNGGRGFARNVKRLLKELYGSTRCFINDFTQSQNKESRIRAAATWIMEHVHYPTNWMHKWPEYYLAMKTYKAKGKNDHEDAQDATTGVAEKNGFGEEDNWLF